jgi:anti-sigma B factor antagonist
MLQVRRLFTDDVADEEGQGFALHSPIPGFDVRTAQNDRTRIVEVEGEIDLLTAPKLARALRDDDAFDAVILDFAKVPFMGSAGLGVIAALHRRLARRGGTVVLAAVHPNVQLVLEISGLLDALVVAADLREARERVARGHG